MVLITLVSRNVLNHICLCIILSNTVFLETNLVFLNHYCTVCEMDKAAQETEDREHRHMADTEHIFKREGISMLQAVIKY